MERKVFGRNVKSFFWSQISGESHAENTEAFNDCKNSLLLADCLILFVLCTPTQNLLSLLS